MISFRPYWSSRTARLPTERRRPTRVEPARPALGAGRRRDRCCRYIARPRSVPPCLPCVRGQVDRRRCGRPNPAIDSATDGATRPGRHRPFSAVRGSRGQLASMLWLRTACIPGGRLIHLPRHRFETPLTTGAPRRRARFRSKCGRRKRERRSCHRIAITAIDDSAISAKSTSHRTCAGSRSGRPGGHLRSA